MKVPRLMRGNAIVRQYGRLKEESIFKGSCAAAMFVAGAMSAANHRATMSVVSCIMSCMYVKELEGILNSLQKLKPQMNEIVSRAKSIYKKNKA